VQKEIEKHLEEIRYEIISQGLSDTLKEEEEILKRQLEERHNQEEILWQKNSRIQWLKEGEKNNKFFHRSMVHKRQINMIVSLENNQGKKIMDHASMEAKLVDYYKEMLEEPI
jgi:hypothetical protein